MAGPESPRGRLILKPRKARPFFARHPWVYGHSVASVEGSPSPGDEVELLSHERVFIARGLFNPSSTIVSRLYRWNDGPLDETFWFAMLDEAVSLRRETLRLGREETAFRLVYSEGDGLSGLIVDQFDRWLVVQFSSLALMSRRDLLLPRLLAITGAEGLIARPDRSLASQEGMDAQDVWIHGNVPDDPITILENGISYLVDLRAGQKTGFYCDQRENRRAVARYCAGKRVLDLYCFTGGFSINALMLGGASSALGVDSSSTALALARRNAELNGVSEATFEGGDVLKKLERLKAEGARFDVVACDPPKFAPHARDLEAALKAYRRLNLAAIGALAPEGLLATCSCSGLVDRRLFAEVLGQAAEESGRPIQILEQRGQAADHPVSATCLETDYLKCFLCRVGPEAS